MIRLSEQSGELATANDFAVVLGPIEAFWDWLRKSPAGDADMTLGRSCRGICDE